jgi:flagellar motility protein MotE (MotC chaperone)
VKRGGLVAILAALLFALSLLGLLGWQGRLNWEGTRDVPLLNDLFAPPVTADGPAGLSMAPGPTSGTRERRPALSGGPGPDGGPLSASRPLFSYPQLPGGVSAEELTAAWLRLDERHRQQQAEAVASEQRAQQLALLAADLEERRQSVRAEMAATEAKSAKLEAKVQAFSERTTRLAGQEVANLQRQAESLQAMDAAAAAGVLLELIPSAEAEAVKLLSTMDADAAAAVLSAMDPKSAARLMERGLRLIREDAGAKGN